MLLGLSCQLHQLHSEETFTVAMIPSAFKET